MEDISITDRCREWPAECRSRGVLRDRRSWDSSILSVSKIISGWVKRQHCRSMVWGRNSSTALASGGWRDVGAEEWVTTATGELYFLFLPHISIYLSTIYLSSIINLSYNYHLSNMKLPNYYLSIFNLSSIYHLSIINLSSFCHLSTYTLRVNTKHQTDCIIK